METMKVACPVMSFRSGRW